MIVDNYTLAEAAAVTEQSVTTINRLIDTGPIARRHVRHQKRQLRVLTRQDLLFLTALQDSVLASLNKATRALLYTKICEAWTGEPKTLDLLPVSETLVLQLQAIVDKLLARLSDLEVAKAIAVEDPEIRGGEPVIQGTRIPVHLVADMLADGATEEEILRGYPTLRGKDLNLIRVYAQAYPRQGRPPKHPWHE